MLTRAQVRRLATVAQACHRAARQATHRLMPASTALIDALNHVATKLRDVRCDDPEAAAKLERALPYGGPEISKLRELLRTAVEAREVAERENDGVRFSRVKKAASDGDLSIDVVHMDKPALGHTHPNGEIDLCFATKGEPQFDNHPAGWVVYGRNSTHVPTVSAGEMLILYFLPGGAIDFAV